MADEAQSYAELLDELAAHRPRVAERLQEAEAQRAQRLQTYLSGARLGGLEQLYGYLQRLEEAYSEHEDLAPFAFLIRRAGRDFETALEATLSAYQGVASDAMRDVMEMEYLLLDFALHDDHAREWLSGDRRLRLSKYSPASSRPLRRGHL